MNPMLQEALMSILRWGLTLLAGWFVSHGVWTLSQSASYVAAASVAILTLGWSLWQKYGARVKLLVALSGGPTTERAVEAHIESGAVTPTVKTDPATIPGVPK